MALTSPGGQRAEMVLTHYDPDPADRVSRLLTDLADYCIDEGLTSLTAIASLAEARAKGRRTR